jgi:Putative phage metallopeptidase
MGHRRHLRKVRVELIPQDTSNPLYTMMRRIRERHHHETRKAKVALAWRIALKPDTDGHLLLGKCIKASDLQRELSEYDFVILLNKEVWEDKTFGHKRQKALLDHELCHIAQVYRKGKRLKNDHGKYVFRLRNHDVEEFSEIVDRHGIWKHDLELFAAALLKRRHKESHASH